MKKPSFYLELAARYHVFILLNLYGWGKLFNGQFYRKGALPPEIAKQTLGNVNSFDLAWTFMGHSYTYILFIGIAQIIGAWCLLWDRTKLLGIAILIPILANIIVFDIVFFETYGALASAIIYFSLLLLVVYLNKTQVLEVLDKMLQKSKRPKESIRKRTQNSAIAGGIIVAIFSFEQLLVNLLGH